MMLHIGVTGTLVIGQTCGEKLNTCLWGSTYRQDVEHIGVGCCWPSVTALSRLPAL